MRASPQTAAVINALRENAGSWSYGYDLSKATGIKSGTLYPLLARLHEEGWLETKWTDSGKSGRPPRHLYRLTPTGLKEAKRVSMSAAAKRGSQCVAYGN